MAVTFLTNEDKAILDQEIGKLSEEITNSYAVRKIKLTDWTMGYYFKTNIDQVDLVGDTDIVATSDYTYQRFEYKKGEKYFLTGRGGNAPRLWSFISSDGTMLSRAGADARESNFVLTYDEDCILIVNVATYEDYALYKETIVDAGYRLDEIENKIETISNVEKAQYIFGTGINCDYITPEIPAFNDPGAQNRLAYFYGLYDDLVEGYPDYVTKIDCDAEMAAAGIVKPENQSYFPMYMYKFEPPFTAGFADLTTETVSKPIKLFVTTGTHGELMAIWDAYQTMRLICEKWKNDANLEALRWECIIYVLPCSGLAAVNSGVRKNINSVDLNRNCPTENWFVNGTVDSFTYSGPEAGSEYETKVFMHYLSKINPYLFIDHHNSTQNSEYPYISFWATSKEQIVKNIAATAISSRCRKLRMRLEGVYPENNWQIDGYVQATREEGSRSLYAHEHGYHSATFETNDLLFYKDGVNVPNGTDKYSETASTIAVDGFLNFVLLALKELAKQPFVSDD